ncbi:MULTISPECIES: peptidoglycan-binding domain-containing protein [Leptolyngbya]|nr:peptidoglycan-binding protein [Leptolyngbya boryana]MBD2370434.1 peptidoglycan-binding protein [Leptolyngbya sp. FACHB-161]MBD2376887.1 peptidoglycan-binding protein [Leptolyngbya sp. FACHB-238]MBD2401254.1 peptidoglycan-binding protein [Leptolyngbya sp. FACHB-239]MBD2407805.1 peptidoglycan-binding protein [Leptolyngbya sp. FACHB-402]ULP29878.1 peptidoglycan-binding protein [Leptolyngbya boryana IU 594]
MRRISGWVMGSLVSGMILCPAVNAARSQDYTVAQFLSVLNGLGYAVPLNAPIDDPRVRQGIREFQFQFQLPVDETLNIPTQDKAADIVRTLQLGLNRTVRPNPELPGSQFYGKQTEEAVKKFQQQNRLPATGIANLETRRRLNDLLNDAVPRTESQNSPPSQPALQSPALSIYTDAQIKAILAGFGYDINQKAPLTDAPTRRAIRELQQIYGLSETGLVNRATEEKLSSVMRNLRNNLKAILRSDFAIAQYYDSATQAAIRQFQARYGLRVTGLANLETRSRLDDEARRLRRN